MMGIDPELARFAVLLEGVDLPTMVVGSVATSAYGEPRATLDTDLVIAAFPEDAERLASAFPSERYYVHPIKVIRRELGRSRGTFNIIDGETSLKADIHTLAADPLNHAGFANRLRIQVPNAGDIFLAPPTTVIGGKLRYFAMIRQDKHLRDICGMLANTAAQIDVPLLTEIAKRLGIGADWRACLLRPGEE